MSTRWRNWAGTEEVTPARVATPATTDEVAAAVTAAVARRPDRAGDRLRALVHRRGRRARAAAPAGPAGRRARRRRGLGSGHRRGRDPAAPAQPDARRARPGDGDPRRHRPADDRRRGLDRHPRQRRGSSAASRPRSARSSWCWPTARWCTCSATERPELFEAARVSIGALGVITKVTLQCVPLYALHAVDAPMPLDETLDEARRAGRRQRPLRVLLVPAHHDRADAPVRAAARRHRAQAR